MKILFIGCVEFSASALKLLLSMNANIIGVCTTKSSTFNSDHCDLSDIALSHDVPTRITTNLSDSSHIEWIEDLSPDIIFCFGWSKLLPSSILSIPPMGILGFHPSSLPANRGRHPLIWALILGLKSTSSTFFFMDAGADSGDILSQKDVKILDSDYAIDLYQKVTQTALKQIREFYPLLLTQSFVRTPQDHSISNIWRKRSSSDGIIDWRMSAKSIYNLVRGLSRPYVGAHFLYRGDPVKVWKTKIGDCRSDNIEPGKILSRPDDSSIHIKAGSGSIILLEIDPYLDFRIGDYL